MSKEILCIAADNNGNKLWLKDFRLDNTRTFIRYKSTFNDIPFVETEIFEVDNNFVITSDNGTVLYRFNRGWIDKLLQNE